MFNIPVADYRKKVEVINAANSDIIRIIETNYKRGLSQVETFAKNFESDSNIETAKNVWKFLKSNIQYKRDPDERQMIRLPARLIADKEGDCKSYSLFVATVLRQLGFKVGFRYVSFTNSTIPTHVYCIARKGNETIIVDGVYQYFNSEKPYSHKIDHWMQVETLSGIESKPIVNGFRSTLNINDPAQLRAFLSATTFKNSLAAKIAAKKLSGSTIRVVYNSEQLKRYQSRLRHQLSMQHKPFAKALLQDELNKVTSGSVNGYIFGLPEDQTIGKIRLKKFFQKIGKGVKKVGLSVPRNSFLTLVGLNVRNLATTLSRANQNDVKRTWEKLGGNWNKLQNTIAHGAKKKSIFGNDSINIAPALVTVIASAAIILGAFATILRKASPKLENSDALKAIEDVGQLANSYTGGTGSGSYPSTSDGAQLGNDVLDGKTDVKESGIFSGESLPLIIGGGALIYMLSKGSKK